MAFTGIPCGVEGFPGPAWAWPWSGASPSRRCLNRSQQGAGGRGRTAVVSGSRKPKRSGAL